MTEEKVAGTFAFAIRNAGDPEDIRQISAGEFDLQFTKYGDGYSIQTSGHLIFVEECCTGKLMTYLVFIHKLSILYTLKG